MNVTAEARLLVSVVHSVVRPSFVLPMSWLFSSSSDSSKSSSAPSGADYASPGDAPSNLEHAPTANDLLMAAYDPAKLHPLAGLGDKLDYLLLDDDKTSDLPGAGTAIPSRGWSDDLCYGTGTMYLSGSCPISFKLLYLRQAVLFASAFACSPPSQTPRSHLLIVLFLSHAYPRFS